MDVLVSMHATEGNMLCYMQYFSSRESSKSSPPPFHLIAVLNNIMMGDSEYWVSIARYHMAQILGIKLSH